jgi:translation initiation factor IF-3
MTPEDAILKAEDVGLDLVEVAPNSRPPVCRIMDYGKYKYEAQKKKKQSKGKSGGLKEVKLRPRTDDHDLHFKVNNARKFLMAGNKVKITLMYRGREMVHRELGYEKLKEVQGYLASISTVESHPRMEGRFLSMMLAPNAAGIAELKKAELEAGVSAEATEEVVSETVPKSTEAE